VVDAGGQIVRFGAGWVVVPVARRQASPSRGGLVPAGAWIAVLISVFRRPAWDLAALALPVDGRAGLAGCGGVTVAACAPACLIWLNRRAAVVRTPA